MAAPAAAGVRRNSGKGLGRLALKTTWFLLTLALTARAAPAAAEPLTSERAFAEPSINGPAAEGVRPSPDGSLVGYLKPAADDPAARVFWVVPAGGGAARPALDLRRLGQASGTLTEAEVKAIERRHASGAEVFDYRWARDGSAVLGLYDNQLYLVPITGAGSPRRLTQAGGPIADPQLSPDGRTVSFARDGRLVLINIASGRQTAIGQDASETVYYGIPDFVTQEEIQRFTGAWWSPDGARLAYTRTDDSKVTQVPRVSVDGQGAKVVMDRFPVTGTANPDVRLFIARRDGSGAIPVDLGPNPDIYLVDVSWSEDGSTLYVQRQSRDQKRLDLLAVDPATGRSRVLLTETSPTWVELERDFRPLRGARFLWGSACTGWQHLYLYDRDGKLIRPVTSGSWRLTNITAAAAPDQSPIVGVDEDRRIVYFTASKDTPVEQQLYAVAYDRPDTPHAITEGHGWWYAAMARDKPTAFVGRYSDPNQPPQTGLYDLSGKRLTWLAENRLDASHPLAPYLDQRPTYAFGTIKAADGEDLQYTLVKPAGFDPAKRYPAIVRVYGGPNVQTVRREWRGAQATDQLYTQAGFVLFQLDNRGTANRSEAFEHQAYHNLGGLAAEDQIAGVRFLKSLPFIDPDRVGITGWSFGGYMSTRLMMTPGSGVRAAMAGGTPTDLRTYDTHYTERYLGTPQEDPAGYAAFDLIPRAKDLSGGFMLQHGMSDDNVSLANFAALVTALQDDGKTFETAVFPGQGHGFIGAPARTRSFRTGLDFLQRALAPR